MEINIKDIDCLVMEPNKPVVGVIQLLHGMQEYKERYIPFMQYLNSLGYATIIHDHKGHGKNTDVAGYFGLGDGWFKLIDDTYEVYKWMKAKYSNVPYIFFGHSMGSIVLRSFFKRHQSIVDGMILCGAPNYNPMSPLACSLAKAVIFFKGSKYPSKMLSNVFFMEANKMYPDLSWLNSDKTKVQEYINDPVCGRPFTASAYYELAKGVIDMHDYRGFDCKNPKLPILFIVGSEDPIVGGEKGLDDSMNVFTNCGFKDVESIVFKGMRHEILNENDHQKVYDEISVWLKQHYDNN